MALTDISYGTSATNSIEDDVVYYMSGINTSSSGRIRAGYFDADNVYSRNIPDTSSAPAGSGGISYAPLSRGFILVT